VTGWEMLAVLAAGMGAGTINTIVGSGSLITFPVLLAVGYPPVLANVSNTVGLVFGGVSGAVGYRRELAGQRARLIRLGIGSTLGAITGGVLLLTLPAAAFRAIVPVLIGLACVLVLVQPRLTSALGRRDHALTHGGPFLWLAVYGAGIYGGYFGAAQGVLLIALLGLFLEEDLQRINGAKNVLALIANLVAALLFVVVTDVAWPAALLIAFGSIAGGMIGATAGRRLPSWGLRAFVVVVGLSAIVQLVR
jgi:uncharacterized membrane protein YfcA